MSRWSLSRFLPLLAAVGIVFAAQSAKGLAAGDTGSNQSAVHYPVLAPSERPPEEPPRASTSGLSPGERLMRMAEQEGARLLLAHETRERERRRPEAAQQRRARRSLYARLTPSEARMLAVQQFPSWVNTPGAGPFSSGRRPTRYLADNVALVEGDAPGGRDGLVVGMQPLRDRDRNGSLAPVDITLASTDNTWRPRNPLTDYAIGGGGRVAFDELAVTVRPDGSYHPGEPLGEAIFYPESLTSTDLLVKPQTTGVEYAWQLRSEASPETLALDFELPRGASLQKGDGIVTIRDGERAVAGVGRVVVVDAQGLPVDASITIEGSRVLITVEHRSQDVSYPLLVDPAVGEAVASHLFPYQGADSFAAWRNYAYPSSKFELTPNSSGGGYGKGLYISSPGGGAGTASYNPGGGPGSADRAGWYYTAPGKARIYRVYNSLHHHVQGWDGVMCMTMGITTPDLDGWNGPFGSAWTEACQWGNFYGSNFMTPNGAALASNAFLVGVYANPGGTNSFTEYFRDAEIYMYDDRDPDRPILMAPVTGENYNVNRYSALSASAHDEDTGVRALTFHGPAGWEGNGKVVTNGSGCAYGVCSKDFYAEVPIATMPDGRRLISVTATDASERSTASHDYTLLFDHNYPVLTVNGTLWDRRNAHVPPGSYTISASAIDAGTGASYVKIRVNGAVLAASGSGACGIPDVACAASYTLDTTTLPEDLHEVTIETTDASHPAEPEVESFTIDTRTSTDSVPPDFPAGLNPTAQLLAPSLATDITWSAAEDPPLPTGSEGSGTQDYYVRYQRNWGTWSGWSLVTSPQLRITGAITGDAIAIEVKARDGAGNLSTTAWASTQVSAPSDPCSPLATGPYPTECSTNESPRENEFEDDDGSTLTRAVTAGTANTANRQFRYRIDVIAGNWTSIRSGARSYAIGNARDGSYIDVQEDHARAKYLLGELHSNGMLCGWVKSEFARSILPGTPRTACPREMYVQQRNLAALANCPPTAECVDGTPVELRRSTPVCANIGLNPKNPGAPKRCRFIRRITDYVGYTVCWRYITKDRGWAMVRDPNVPKGAARWVFIRASALPIAPPRQRPGSAGCPS